MPKKIIIVTGDRCGGKTTKMRELAGHYRELSLNPAGVLSVNVTGVDGGPPDKTRYYALDITTGERRLLASEGEREAADPFAYKRFYFSRETFVWAEEIIARGFSSPVLMIDEIGPLELERNGFYRVAIKAIETYTGTLILAVRKELVGLICGLLSIINPTVLNCS